jgi:hypothetical protein
LPLECILLIRAGAPCPLSHLSRVQKTLGHARAILRGEVVGKISGSGQQAHRLAWGAAGTWFARAHSRKGLESARGTPGLPKKASFLLERILRVAIPFPWKRNSPLAGASGPRKRCLSSSVGSGLGSASRGPASRHAADRIPAGYRPTRKWPGPVGCTEGRESTVARELARADREGSRLGKRAAPQEWRFALPAHIASSARVAK